MIAHLTLTELISLGIMVFTAGNGRGHYSNFIRVRHIFETKKDTVRRNESVRLWLKSSTKMIKSVPALWSKKG